MPISITDSIQLRSALPLDSRSVATSVASFNDDYPASTYPEGQVTYFTEDSELKIYNGSSWNAVALKSDIPIYTSDLEDDIGYLIAHQKLSKIAISRSTIDTLSLTANTNINNFSTTLSASDFIYSASYFWNDSSAITSTCDIYLDSLTILRDNSVHARGYCKILYTDASKTDDDLPINMATFMSFLCGKVISYPTLCRGRYTITDWSSASNSTSITLFGLTVSQTFFMYTPCIDLTAYSTNSFMVTHYLNNSVASASAGTLNDAWTTKKTSSGYAVMGTTSTTTSEDNPVSVGFWYDFIIS